MHILFLTTANLSSNPRLVKELRVALANNFEVTVLLFELKQWTSELEVEYQKEFSRVTLVYLPVLKRSFYSWLKSSLINYLSKKTYSLFKSRINLAAFASDKRSLLLYQKLMELGRNEVDLVISHNLGALYPAFQYAKKHKTPFAFDVEDYHPGEVIATDAENEKKRREYLMKQILPQAAFVTAASPLIAEHVEKFCQVPAITINNSFYSSEFTLPNLNDIVSDKIKLVWFSQHINHGRGLELLISALDTFRDYISLTLIGNLNHNFADNWLNEREYIKIIAPLPQIVLHKELSKYDIGLALELSSADLNKDIALSNKIFAYKQAGLYVIATNTKAQADFMNWNKKGGYICGQSVNSLAEGISFIIKNISTIREGKSSRFSAAKNIAFETEVQKLVDLWQKAVLK